MIENLYLHIFNFFHKQPFKLPFLFMLNNELSVPIMRQKLSFKNKVSFDGLTPELPFLRTKIRTKQN